MPGSYSWHVALERVLSGRHEAVRPAETALMAVVLSGLLVVVVPVLALLTDVSLLVLVPLAGVAYLGFALTRNVIAAAGAALFVLVTFNANVPLVGGTGLGSADVFLLDLAVVALGGLLLARGRPDLDLPFLARVALGSLGLLVGWLFLAAAVGNGPSPLTAALVGLSHVRFLLVAGVATLFVAQTDPRCAIYPLLVGVGGQVAFAVAQSFNGSLFGLSYLGETSDQVIGTITFGPLLVTAGQYTGGFAGTTRVLVGLVLLALPLFVVTAVCVHRRIAIGTGGVLVGASLVHLSVSDAGWAAFALGVTLLGGLLWATADTGSRRAQRWSVSVLAAGVVYSVMLRTWGTVESAVEGLVSALPAPGGGGEGGQPAADGGTTPPPSSETPTTADGSTPTSAPSTTGTETTTTTTTQTTAATPTTTPRRPGGGGLIDADTLGIRFQQYVAALDVGSTHPLFGLGGGNFRLVATSYGLPRAMRIHNPVLAYLAAGGVPGAVLYSVAVGSVGLLAAWLVVRNAGDRRRLALGLLCGLVGFHAYSFWTTVYATTTANATLWALSGIVIGAATGWTGGEEPADED